jgi:hypothetical protein
MVGGFVGSISYGSTLVTTTGLSFAFPCEAEDRVSNRFVS